jgi:hypothetical protein
VGDLNSTIEIKAKRGQLIKVTVGFSIILACGVVYATGYVQSPPRVQIASWVAIAVFGLFLARLLWQLATSPNTVVILSPEGLRDSRYSSNLIPWSVIQNVTAWSEEGQAGIILSLPLELREQLGSSAADKLYRTQRRNLFSRMRMPQLTANEVFIYTTPLAFDQNAIVAAIESRMRSSLR